MALAGRPQRQHLWSRSSRDRGLGDARGAICGRVEAVSDLSELVVAAVLTGDALPCPACVNSDNRRVDVIQLRFGGYSVRCHLCGIRTSASTRNLAEKRWNGWVLEGRTTRCV